MKHYEFSLDELSYHQVRCLCLLGLIVLHVVSFCNENYRVPLEHYDFWSLLSLTALYNGMFVFAAGVSLRIMLSPWVKGHRVQKHRLSYIFDFLFYLLLIDMCKVVILFGRNALLEWDFLKTIALSYIVIYFFSRISILCLIPLATGCAYYFQDIEKFLRSFEVTTSEPTWQFWGMNTYHLIVLGIFAVFYIFLAGQVFAKIEKRFIKSFLLFLVTFLFLFLGFYMVNIEPSPREIKTSTNWFLWMLIGRRSELTLFPFLAWFQTIAFGFLWAHFFTRMKGKIKTQWLQKEVFLYSSLCCLSVLYYIYSNEAHYGPNYLFMWSEAGTQESTFLGEALYVFLFTTNFLFFLQFNKHVRIHENIRRLIYQYSSASFWAYLVATTWPVMLSRIKIESLDFIYFLIFGLLSTFFISHVVVKVVNFVNRKKIVFRLSSS